VKSDSKHELPESSDWEDWVHQHAPRLLLYARQQARAEADAQDLVQEAIVECWERQGESGLPPLAMVFATIRRRAIDLARSEDRRGHREARALENFPHCWFDSGPEQRESNHLIESAMRQLPDIYREVVTLRIWGELTFAEIAELTGAPPNTIASRYRYGLMELRKLTKGVLA
jgi:RNA polymerase sigma-70 factor, ECF subfamily